MVLRLRGAFGNSYSCISASLLFCGLSALILSTACSRSCIPAFIYDVDSRACLAAILWYCSFVELWLCSWGPVVSHTSHSLSFISLFLLCYCPLRALGHLHCSVVLYFTLQLGFGCVLSGSRRAFAGILGSCTFAFSPLNTLDETTR